MSFFKQKFTIRTNNGLIELTGDWLAHEYLFKVKGKLLFDIFLIFKLREVPTLWPASPKNGPPFETPTPWRFSRVKMSSSSWPAASSSTSAQRKIEIICR
jgi:hypothetical protein